MRKRLFHKIFAIFLLGVFFYSTTPPDFLHKVFANHKDTVDKPLGKTDQISFKHTHCLFLTIIIAPYVAPEKNFASKYIKVVFQTLHEYTYDSYHSVFIHISYLRGPPIA
jgi:hypothetical protein